MSPQKSMISRILTVLVLALPLATGIAHAACDRDPECDQSTEWSKFTSIKLVVSDPGQEPDARWHGRFDPASNDIAIDMDIKAGEGPALKGVVAMVGGRVMLTKGLELPKGYEIDFVDGPILNMKLVALLLGREFPAGPSSVSGSWKIDRTDKVGIKYATPSASGYIPAPWTLAGTIARDASGSVEYDLVLTFPVERRARASDPPTQRMRLQGQLAMLGEPALPALLSLEGWKTYGVGPKEERQGSSTILDFGATPRTDTRFRNVDEVRAYIRDEYGTGKPDPTKDFTGSWKKSCDQDFGLKIIRQGDEGKYAVLFCGPGGCDDPARQRLTHITGDKGYEVVGDDVLLSGRSKKSRYVRCSRDPGEIRVVSP